MRVGRMNARPSLRFDLMRATDNFGKPISPPGFYYKTFIRPRRLWPLYEGSCETPRAWAVWSATAAAA